MSPNQSPEPTAVGAFHRAFPISSTKSSTTRFASAVADDAANNDSYLFENQNVYSNSSAKTTTERSS